MKALIDKFISDNYDKLMAIAISHINKFNRNIKAEELITNAYLNVVDNPPKEKELIPNFIVNYIKQECFYPCSKTNREAIGRPFETIPNQLTESGNIEEAIIFMDWLSKYDDFKNGLTVYEQIICDVYFIKGIKSTRDMAEHFQMKHSSLYKEIRHVLKKIKRFEHESKKGI